MQKSFFLHKVLALLLTLFLVTACSSKEQAKLPPPPTPSDNPATVTWNQETGGLSYHIEASKDLNRAGEENLGLTLCVYQLEDSSTFQALSSSPDGLDQLLDCKLESAKARASRSFLVQPGKAFDIVQDRVEKARYFAVVAGYAHLEPDLCTAIIPFPIHSEKVGIIFRDTVYTAAPMQALIHLGAESVTISGVERVQ